MSELLFEKSFETPIGAMRALACDDGLCALEFLKPDRERLLSSRLKKWFADSMLTSDHHRRLDEVEQWLDAYFHREFERLPTISLAPRGTEFELAVWKEMQNLAPGRTISYAGLAANLGRPHSSRAVGNASRRNSIALIIPCHRVVGSSGSLTGYGGGLEQKGWLLNHERNAAPSQRNATQSEFVWT